jgi:hypothetical protein
MERYLGALRALFAAENKELVAFERYLTLRKVLGLLCVRVFGGEE